LKQQMLNKSPQKKTILPYWRSITVEMPIHGQNSKHTWWVKGRMIIHLKLMRTCAIRNIVVVLQSINDYFAGMAVRPDYLKWWVSEWLWFSEISALIDELYRNDNNELLMRKGSKDSCENSERSPDPAKFRHSFSSELRSTAQYWKNSVHLPNCISVVMSPDDYPW
jgi:hypothetical protein